MRTRTVLWIVGGLLVLTAVLLIVAARAAAATVISIDTVHRGDPGELFHEGTITAVVGDECVAVLSTRNPSSLNPDSDILVGPVVFFDVERDNIPRTGTKTFTAAGPIDVFVRLGGDGSFSAGFTLEVTCNPPTTTTPVPPSPSTTVSVPTTTPPTSQVPVVTTPIPRGVDTGRGAPPEGGVDAGGGSTAPASFDWGWGDYFAGFGVAVIAVAVAGLAWAVVASGTRKGRHDG